MKKFSCAIHVDPTCIQGYMCRSEAYQRLSNVMLFLYGGVFILSECFLDVVIFAVN